MVSPTKLLTTGTTDAPRPRSSANRAPDTAVGESPARAAAFARRAGFVAVARSRRRVARAVAATVTAVTNSTIATAPRPSATASALNPAAGSTSRARPIGITGDASSAPTTATAAATTPRALPRKVPSAMRSRVLMPSAESTVSSRASSAAWRTSTCPNTTAPASAVRPPRIISETWLGRIARPTEPSDSARLNCTVISTPSFSAWACSVAMDCPGRNRTRRAPPRSLTSPASRMNAGVTSRVCR